MKRHSILLMTATRLTIFGCVLAGLSLMGATSKLLANEKPNVVLMLADNVGWGDIGVYGGGEIRGMPTPNID